MKPNWLDRRLRRLQGPDRPWTILLQAELDHLVARRDVEDAWAAVAAARPELHVVLSPESDWAVDTTDAGLVVGAVEPELDCPRSTPGARPLSIVIDGDPARTIAVIADHALTDGLGLKAILEDLLAALTGRAPAPRPPVTDAALDGLRTRRLGIDAALAQIPPRRLLTIGTPGTATRRATAMVDLATVHDHRRRHDVSVGAVVIDAALGALRSSTLPLGAASGSTVALGVPVDLRRHLDGHPTGVGNAVVNITIADPANPDLPSIDRSIAQQTTARHLSDTLSWMRRVTRPGPARDLPRSGRAVATAMLSNLGPLGDDSAWADVNRVIFAPPAHQTISVGVTGHRDKLAITVRSRLAGDDITGVVAEELADRLRSGSRRRLG